MGGHVGFAKVQVMDFRLLIDGQLVAGHISTSVINPATEEVLAECPRASERQLDAAVTAARAAFPRWAATPVEERRAMLWSIADRIDTHAEELARLLTREQGKPIGSARGELRFVSQTFRTHAGYELPLEVMTNSAGQHVEVHRKPLGVVALILPWNFPMALLAFKLPFALLSGNTVIVKPAPTTPLTTLRLGELVRDLVPPGVMNVIADMNDLGEALTRHPDIRKLSFTGSVATGRKVMAGAADTLKRVSLELGGNDAAIVLDDADPGTVAPSCLPLPSETAVRSASQSSDSMCTRQSTKTSVRNWRLSRTALSSGTALSRERRMGRSRTERSSIRYSASSRMPKSTDG
jgi:acyl-CoA reductase-like NAD-dependent aldehyde dehydrogenase